MSNHNYDRLSTLDNSFLLMETHDVHTHVASTLLFDAGPLRTEVGGIDVEAIKSNLLSSLHHIPRYRQRLQWIPFANHAVWVDDNHFDLDFHIRHTALPKPGSAEQLKKLSARIMAQPLDRKRPLWETWVVEGVDAGAGFALITKIHHCMIDGSSGVDLAYILLSPSPVIPEPEKPPTFVPRPAPSGTQLWRDEAARFLALPLEIAQGMKSFVEKADDIVEDVSIHARALLGTLSSGLSTDETPLNGKVGPHRAFDWLELPLDDLKAIRKAWGCTINDVVLTVVTGAVREYLIQRGVDPGCIEFRVSAPVSVRSEKERGQMGNRVSSWIVPLPIGESDPQRQLHAVRAETRRLKKTRQALGVEMMMKVAEWTPSTLLSLGARAISGPINTIVTNVPGPTIPLYCCGARLRAIYPQVPLLENLGLGIAIISYAGNVYWGFNADPGLVPDLDQFVEKVHLSLSAARNAAGLAKDETRRARIRKRAGPMRPPPQPEASTQ